VSDIIFDEIWCRLLKETIKTKKKDECTHNESSVGIVRSQTQTMEFVLFVVCLFVTAYDFKTSRESSVQERLNPK
jgi:hypothetical protein